MILQRENYLAIFIQLTSLILMNDLNIYNIFRFIKFFLVKSVNIYIHNWFVNKKGVCVFVMGYISSFSNEECFII